MIPLLLGIACTLSTDDKDDGDTNENVPDPVCDTPTEVACVDEMILNLSLHDDEISNGDVETSTDGGDFVTTMNASAGGADHATDNPWVYVRFDDDGAHRVDIDDESALESMDWDLAARRFILRLNGGSSGPSCVGAAALYDFAYDEVTAVPDGVTYGYDDYYTESCDIVNDSSGLPGSPQVVLGPWWEYPGCVKTTDMPFLIQLADGRVIKLVVEEYYGEGQEECNASGAMGDKSGHYTMRWAWLP